MIIDIETFNMPHDVSKVYSQTAKKISLEMYWSDIKNNYADWQEFNFSDSKNVVWTIEFIEAINMWLDENFGPSGERYIPHPDLTKLSFLIKDPKDYAWMVLKWR
jgi:hypothetical protein